MIFKCSMIQSATGTSTYLSLVHVHVYISGGVW